MNGWYKQQRNLSERAWFQDALMVQLYHYLKERAYVSDGSYEGVRIRRGSCPVTRSEISEVTGISPRTLDRKLKNLISYGEIIVKGNNRFTIVTICDYDSCGQSESLFGTADGITDGTTNGIASGTADGTPHLFTKEYRNNKEDNILISPYSSYKKDKYGLAYEIKDRWNRMFDGQLKLVERLTMPTKMAVINCVNRFGNQSVDLVFEQVKLEHERTGFVANFQFVFEQINFQGYLKRAQVRKSNKQHEPQPEAKKSVGIIDVEPQQKKEDVKFEKLAKRIMMLRGLADMALKDSCNARKAVWYPTLLKAYESGELKQLGIYWKPTKE